MGETTALVSVMFFLDSNIVFKYSPSEIGFGQLSLRAILPSFGRTTGGLNLMIQDYFQKRNVF